MYTKCFSTLICCGWAYGCTITLLRLCNFRKTGVGLSPSDVAMSWLRPQTPMDCIPHPYYMYTKCFSTLICCGWAYGCTLTLLSLCRLGVGFRKTGIGLSPSDVAMSWLRLQTPLDRIPHPYHMYTKCFSTLICCGWAYGCTRTLVSLCRLGVGFRKIGVGLSQSDVAIAWLRLQTPVDCIQHPYHMYTKCFSTLICCGWAYGCTLTLVMPVQVRGAGCFDN
jgi:hypothetical protein